MNGSYCFFCRIRKLTPVIATYGVGCGSVNVTLTVFLSTASTDFTASQEPTVGGAVSFVVTYFHVNTTSSAVKSEPSDHFTPGFNFQVAVVPSDEKPPFAVVGNSAARPSTGLPSPPKYANGSTTSVEASESLVPCERCGFKIVTACQYSRRSVPHEPAALAVLAVVAVAAGAALVAVAWAPGADVAGALAAAALVAGALVAGALVGATVVAGAPHAPRASATTTSAATITSQLGCLPNMSFSS